MLYLLIYLIFYPILLILSIFRNENKKSLVIQTAKIGDYVNSTVLFNKLDKFDIVIDKINYPFAKNCKKIDNIYIINNYKKGVLNKLKLAFILFWNNYEKVYILMPNSFNLFLGKFCFTAIITIQHYSNKWYEKLLMIGMKKIIHTKNDLTLKSYLKMINENNLEKNWKNLPLIKPKKNLINSNKFKVGISLSAGNKMKTIDNETWKEIFKILDKFNLEIYIFGLENEKVYLDKIKKFNSKNRIISLLGKISLEELPFYISQTNLYISSDTGNSYIADSFKIPLINFAGPCYMQEQRPIGKDVLVIESNAKCVPFSFIFKAPYETKCNNLYKINEKQEKEIEKFITKIYKEFRSS
jgi:ADP-heptose:LPS heptosyltransferase